MEPRQPADAPASERSIEMAAPGVLDRYTARVYGHYRTPPPSPDELSVATTLDGCQPVLDRLADGGAHADRRTTAVITGAGFAATLSGAPIIAAVGHRTWFLPALVLSVGALLSGIRAMTRSVEGRAGLPATWEDIVAARELLLQKRAWGWLGARLLRLSIYWLAALTAVLSLVR
jgi:hypothetical protein